MKFNKWTIGLAAVGVVSLASAVQAQDTANTVLTALSSTTISGYVDTSAQWNFGTGNDYLPPYRFNSPNKADGFNLDVIQLSIAKPLDDSQWAAGYRVDLWFGPDANALGTSSTGNPNDFAIRQAYVAFRTPIGNGIDWKMGVFDSIIGYESVASPNDPNYTRSYGNSIEPQTHTGLLGTYRFCDTFSLTLGIANTMYPAINSRAQDGSVGAPTPGSPFATYFPGFVVPGGAGANAYAESYKTYMGSMALTAPDSMGFLSGSTLYGGLESGYNNSVLNSGLGMPQMNAYVGATIATPVTGLRAGVAYDQLFLNAVVDGIGRVRGDIWALAGYLSFQATEKFSLHGRVDYVNSTLHEPQSTSQKIFALTGTAQYDLWKNVISRLEFRWDHSASGDYLFGGTTSTGSNEGPNRLNAFVLAANIIYKF
jgi:hypothetical protein